MLQLTDIQENTEEIMTTDNEIKRLLKEKMNFHESKADKYRRMLSELTDKPDSILDKPSVRRTGLGSIRTGLTVEVMKALKNMGFWVHISKVKEALPDSFRGKNFDSRVYTCLKRQEGRGKVAKKVEDGKVFWKFEMD